MIAPTTGFGLVYPFAFWARLIAILIYFLSFSVNSFILLSIIFLTYIYNQAITYNHAIRKSLRDPVENKKPWRKIHGLIIKLNKT